MDASMEKIEKRKLEALKMIAIQLNKISTTLKEIEMKLSGSSKVQEAEDDLK